MATTNNNWETQYEQAKLNMNNAIYFNKHMNTFGGGVVIKTYDVPIIEDD